MFSHLVFVINLYIFLICKSIWIKASAKWLILDLNMYFLFIKF